MFEIFQFLYSKYGKAIIIGIFLLIILEFIRRYYEIADLRYEYKVNKEEIKKDEQKQ